MYRQTDLFPNRDTAKPPYNGLFFCPIRQAFHKWDDHINFYKKNRL